MGIKLPLGTELKDGILTNTAQNIAGAKTFYNAAATKVVGSVSDDGATIWGHSGVGSGLTHLLRSNGQTVLEIKGGGGSATTRAIINLYDGAGTIIGGIGTSATSEIVITQEVIGSQILFRTGAGGANGTISYAGAWTFGQNAGGVDHQFNGRIRFSSVEATPTGVGVRQSATNVLALYVNSIDRLTIDGTNLTSTQAILGPDGGAGAPTYSWTSDPNTGMFNNGNGIIAFGSNGNNIMTNTGSGGWTLGTTTLAAVHVIASNNTGNDMFVSRNYDTSTSSDNRSGLRVVKGSTTTGTSQRYIRFTYNNDNNDNGYITAVNSTTVGFLAASDRRIKKDIVSLTGALEKLDLMRPVSYKLKINNEEQVGFVAQEMYEVFPDKVSRSDDGTGEVVPEGIDPWQITESGMIAYLVAAIKELKARVEELEAMLT